MADGEPVTLQFGTDGIRGDARTELGADLVASLGRAGAEVLGSAGFVVGRDTRASGPNLARALHRGVAGAGGSSVDLGVVATPAVALWCQQNNVAGAMISASHNPWYDNGVKFFASGGSKLSDIVQDEIQNRFDELLGGESEPEVVSVTDRSGDGVAAHVASVVNSLNGRRLAGQTVVIDAANGAASSVAPTALRALGVEVIVTHGSPDGHNINAECGSTHPESLQSAVVAHGADLGLAFDGDADRLLAVSGDGCIVDGDQILAVCALDAHQRGKLARDTVVVTVMTNLGFRRSMNTAGILMVDTNVGDRYVLEALDSGGYSLGGEQSGHIIFRDIACTGDGLLTAVQLLDIVVRTGRSLSDLATSSMIRLPQVLQSVTVADRSDDLGAVLAPLAAAAQTRLAGRGRVLIRPSGTEPVVRVMVEAETDAEAQMEADALSQAVTALFG